jgi:hypothetical protein
MLLIYMIGIFRVTLIKTNSQHLQNKDDYGYKSAMNL